MCTVQHNCVRIDRLPARGMHPDCTSCCNEATRVPCKDIPDALVIPGGVIPSGVLKHECVGLRCLQLRLHFIEAMATEWAQGN